MMKFQDLHVKRFRTDRETAAVKFRKMFSYPGKLLRIIVHPGDYGNPDQEHRNTFHGFRQMFQNGIQVTAGTVTKNFRSSRFQIGNCQIRTACRAGKFRSHCIAFKSGMNPMPFQSFHAVEQFRRLQSWLPSSERHAAEIMPARRQQQNLLFQILRRTFPSDPFQRRVFEL